MNSITELLDLEDSDIFISDTKIEDDRKVITLETHPTAHFCPCCGFRMHSRGIKTRTISHPILQDGYKLVLLLNQRRWRCTNPECKFETNDEFRFVNRSRRCTNATDMLVVLAFRDLSESAASIAKKFKTSDTHVLDIFDRYVKLNRLPLTDIISVDEVYTDMADDSKYALVIQDFHTGDPIDILRSRRSKITEPYFAAIPPEERNQVKYLLSDMYNPYLAFVDKYFPNAVSVVDSFHVVQWVIHSIDEYIRQLERYFRKRDKEPIINSFVMVEKYGPGGIYNSRLSNGPIESLNRKVKDLKRLGRGFRNFEHFRNRFLYATRNNPILYGSDDRTQIQYYVEDTES